MQAVPHWYEICGVLAAEITEFHKKRDVLDLEDKI